MPSRYTVTTETRGEEDSLPTGKLLPVDGPYDLRQPRDVTSLVLDDIYTDLVTDTDGLVPLHAPGPAAPYQDHRGV